MLGERVEVAEPSSCCALLFTSSLISSELVEREYQQMSLGTGRGDAALGACLCEDDVESKPLFTYFSASRNLKQSAKIAKSSSLCIQSCWALTPNAWHTGAFSAEEAALSAQAGRGDPLIWEAAEEEASGAVTEKAFDFWMKTLCVSRHVQKG